MNEQVKMCFRCVCFVYLGPVPVDDVVWGVVDLALHLDRLLLIPRHLHPQDTEVGAAQIQSYEVSLLCQVIQSTFTVLTAMEMHF